MNEDLSDRRKATISPISSGSPILLNNEDLSRASLALGSSSKYLLTPGVLIVPGETAFTLIFFLAIFFEPAYLNF